MRKTSNEQVYMFNILLAMKITLFRFNFASSRRPSTAGMNDLYAKGLSPPALYIETIPSTELAANNNRCG